MWGRKFKIYINHVSLKYLLKQKISYPSQHLWLANLLGFDYEIEYQKGKENVATNALSRTASYELFIIEVFTIFANIIREIQKS